MNRVSRILAAATAGLALSLAGCQPQGDVDLGAAKSAVPDPIEIDLRLNHIQAKGICTAVRARPDLVHQGRTFR